MVKSDPVRDPGARRLREALAQALQELHRSRGRQRVRVSVDIDPVAVL